MRLIKNNTIAIVLIYCLLPSSIFANVNKQDSLLQIIANSSGEVKSRALNKYCDLHVNLDKAEYLKTAIEAYNYAKATSYEREIYAISNLFDAFRINKQYDSADYYIEIGAAISLKHSDTTNIIYFLANRGISDMYFEKYNDAKHDFLLVKQLFESYSDTIYKKKKAINHSRLLNNIATVYVYQSYYDSALYYFEQSYNFRIKIGAKPQHLAGIAINISSLYQKQKDYKNALVYLNKALEYSIILKDTSLIAKTYNNRGNCYKNLGDTSLAILQYKTSLKFSKKPIYRVKTLINLGILEMQRGKLNKAQQYLEEAHNINDNERFKSQYSSILSNLGLLYVAQEKYTKAIEVGEESIVFLKKNNEREDLATTYLMLSSANSGIENYKSSLKYYKLHTALNDSIFNTKVQKHYNELQTKFKSAEQERDIHELKAEKAIQEHKENTLIVSIFGILAVLISIIIGFVLKRKKDSEIQNQKEILHQKEKALASSELEKSKLKEKELNTQLEYKSKQLTSHALNMMKKNKFLHELESDISDIRKEAGEDVKAKLRRVNSLIKRNNKSDKDWELFKNYFEEVNKGFYERLNVKHPGLSSNDYKLCALIKLNMNIKESASVLNISPESVKTARYRLRKKLEMNADQDLHELINMV